MLRSSKVFMETLAEQSKLSAALSVSLSFFNGKLKTIFLNSAEKYGFLNRAKNLLKDSESCDQAVVVKASNKEMVKTHEMLSSVKIKNPYLLSTAFLPQFNSYSVGLLFQGNKVAMNGSFVRNLHTDVKNIHNKHKSGQKFYFTSWFNLFYLAGLIGLVKKKKTEDDNAPTPSGTFFSDVRDIIISGNSKQALFLQVPPQNSTDPLSSKLRKRLTEPTLSLPYPSDYLLANFADLVYERDFKKHSEKLDKTQGWELLMSGQETSGSGFLAKAYWNKQLKQIVIAFAGTEPDVWHIKPDIITDVKLMQGRITQQQVDALNFLNAVLAYGKKENLFSLEGEEEFGQPLEEWCLSVTGHSLGGWLAQMVAAHAYLGYGLPVFEQNKVPRLKQSAPWVQVHCVVFDPPGVREMIESILRSQKISDQDIFSIIENLNIKTMLSAPNPVNTANQHIGTLYRCVTQPNPSWDPNKTFGSMQEYLEYAYYMHTMKRFLSCFKDGAWQEDTLFKVRAWPSIKYEKYGKTLDLLEGIPEDIIENISRINRVLRDADRGKHYLEFFKQAGYDNKYHPNAVSDNISFETYRLLFEIAYNTESYDSNAYPVRHLPWRLRELLVRLVPMATLYDKDFLSRFFKDNAGLFHLPSEFRESCALWLHGISKIANGDFLNLKTPEELENLMKLVWIARLMPELKSLILDEMGKGLRHESIGIVIQTTVSQPSSPPVEKLPPKENPIKPQNNPIKSGDREDSSSNSTTPENKLPPPIKNPLRFLRVLSGHTSSITAFEFLPTGYLVSGSEGHDGTIKIWDYSTGFCLRTLKSDPGESILNLHVLGNGTLASVSRIDYGYEVNHIIKIWDLSNGKRLWTLSDHDDKVTSLKLLSNNTLASGSLDNNIKIWDLSSGNCLYTLGHAAAVVCLQPLPKGWVASSSYDKTIKIWNASSGACLRTLTDHTEPVCFLEVLANGDLVSGSNDKTIKIWNVSTGQCLRTLSGHTERITAFQVLANGNLVSGSGDKTIKIWNAATGECLHTLSGHTSEIISIELLSNGHLASRCREGIMKIWDLSTGACLDTLEKFRGQLIKCLPDDKIVSYGRGGLYEVGSDRYGIMVSELKSLKLEDTPGSQTPPSLTYLQGMASSADSLAETKSASSRPGKPGKN